MEITIAELQKLHESEEHIEFKEAKNEFSFEKLGEYFSALSNEANLKKQKYAWLIFGITDKVPRKVSGTNYREGIKLQKLKEEIAEAEKSEMWISYADTGNEGRYLYIVKGYGRQETTGYSIEVNECYETEHTVVVRTTLLGPQKKEKTHKKKTYPYIVIKIPYTDKQIIYE